MRAATIAALFGEGILVGEVVGIVEEGNRLVRFEYEGIFEEILGPARTDAAAPYITHQLEDKNRYQTVYAKHTGIRSGTDSGTPFYTGIIKRDRRKRH